MTCNLNFRSSIVTMSLFYPTFNTAQTGPVHLMSLYSTWLIIPKLNLPPRARPLSRAFPGSLQMEMHGSCDSAGQGERGMSLIQAYVGGARRRQEGVRGGE